MPPAKTKKPFTPKLERFLGTVAYDGTDHIGWQVQAGRLSIEGELEARLSRILKTPIDIHGSGRTDSGVHSVGQRFHFDAFCRTLAATWCTPSTRASRTASW
jgi:tRNA pseudouridine38-40 synthase